MKRALPFLLLALVPATASAKTFTGPNINSPSKLITCFAVVDSKEIECSANYMPQIGMLDPYFALKPKGKTRLGERGDFPGYNKPFKVVPYGSTWKRPGITCHMKESGFTCRNKAGHGFHLARGDIRRF